MLAIHRETKQLPIYLLELDANGHKLKESEPGEKLAVTSKEESGILHVTFHGLRMPGFAGVLTATLGRPVRDQTGLTGMYDFQLDYAPDMNGAVTEPGPSVFTAAQELGLKLKAGKGPVEILVIDHVEHASEN
jgi:uncharacterized protein (TIGR03435 family)